MAKINLLPWRVARRKQRQQEFLTLLGFAAVAAIVLSLLIVMYYNGQIDGQTARNQYLTDQIAIVDKQIDEIKELDKKKDGLLRRKKVIEELANVKERDSIVGKVTFDDHGQNTVAVITKYVVQDGKFVEWDDSEYATGKRKLPGQK